MTPSLWRHLSPKKRSAVLAVLSETYPQAASELKFQNEYQLVVAVMLSAQTTDKKVNEVTPLLFREFPNFRELMEAPLERLESITRPLNYYRTKSRHLIGIGERVTHEFHGKLPETHKELISLPGVGNKTANVVLSERGIAHALAVDTHVFRLAHRLGLSQGKTVTIVEEDLKKQYPSSEWRNLHHCLILHGRRICIARRPKCEECTLAKLCPSYELFTGKKSPRSISDVP